LSKQSGRGRPEWVNPQEALLLFLTGATIKVGVRVSALVGTILSAVNQGSVIAGGHATWVTWIRVAVNYLTPFLVSSVGYLAGCRTAPHQGPTR